MVNTNKKHWSFAYSAAPVNFSPLIIADALTRTCKRIRNRRSGGNTVVKLSKEANSCALFDVDGAAKEGRELGTVDAEARLPR